MVWVWVLGCGPGVTGETATVESPREIVSLVSSEDGFCSLTRDGDADCWGSGYVADAPPTSQGFDSITRVFGAACGTRPGGGECWGLNYAPGDESENMLDQEILALTTLDNGCGYKDGVASCWRPNAESSIRLEHPDAVKLTTWLVAHACLLGRDGTWSCGDEEASEGAVWEGLPEFVTDIGVWESGACSTGADGLQCVGRLAPVPPPIGAAATRIQIVASGTGCAIIDSEVECWGYGSLKDLVPAGEFKLVEVSWWGETACAVTLDDRVECFGKTEEWQVWPAE